MPKNKCYLWSASLGFVYMSWCICIDFPFLSLSLSVALCVSWLLCWRAAFSSSCNQSLAQCTDNALCWAAVLIQRIFARCVLYMYMYLLKWKKRRRNWQPAVEMSLQKKKMKRKMCYQAPWVAYFVFAIRARSTLGSRLIWAAKQMSLTTTVGLSENSNAPCNMLSICTEGQRTAMRLKVGSWECCACASARVSRTPWGPTWGGFLLYVCVVVYACVRDRTSISQGPSQAGMSVKKFVQKIVIGFGSSLAMLCRAWRPSTRSRRDAPLNHNKNEAVWGCTSISFTFHTHYLIIYSSRRHLAVVWEMVASYRSQAVGIWDRPVRPDHILVCKCPYLSCCSLDFR